MKAWEHDVTSAALNALAKDIFSWADAKGFWPMIVDDKLIEPYSKSAERLMLAVKSQKIMLVVTELAELVEGLRKPEPASIEGFTHEEEEVADAIIRLLDYAGAYGLRVGEALAAKMVKNEGRPFRHGKEF